MKRLISLLTLLCLLLAGCELPVLNLGDKSTGGTDATEETGDPFYDDFGNRIGTIFFHRDENGVVQKEEWRFDDGTVVVYNYQYGPDGKRIGREYVRSDGSNGTDTFYEDGGLKSSEVLYADGTKIEKAYYESGAVQWDLVTYTDGSKAECTYTEAGTLKTTSLLCLDGTAIDCSYHDNGVVASFRADGPAGVYELNYTEDGAPVGVEREMNTPSSVHFEEVGGDVAGKMTKEYNPDGYLKKVVIEYEDISRFEESYYDNGTTYCRLTKDHTANRIEWYFYENGAVKTYRNVSDKVTYSNFVLPNGRFGGQSITDRDKKIMRELSYDMSGTILERSEIDLS